jgi:phosphotriesterase-related protein
MGAAQIQTVTGPISAAELGRTLMHEHLLIGYPGWESDTLRPGTPRDEALAICKDRIAQMRDAGIEAMVDPCPNDLGRDVEFAAEVSTLTGFPIVCATGLYKEAEGGTPYWKLRASFGEGARALADLFVHELTVGIGRTGIRAGIIKVATGHGEITRYERMVLEAAALASLETGAPITTHTDEGRLGDEQQAILTSHGVPAHRIVIGHSCGTDDHDYHLRIARGGSYLGFDRFGLDMIFPDDKRVASLLKLLAAGAAARVVVSHDTVWCWRGEPFPASRRPALSTGSWEPTHFSARIVGRLKAGGASDAQIDLLLLHNPRRLFAGEPLPPLA